MIEEKAVIEYIKNNPNTNRRGLYSEFLGNASGKQRRKLTSNLLAVLGTLLKKGMVVESDVKRVPKGNSIADSRLNLHQVNGMIALFQDAKTDLHDANLKRKFCWS